MAFSKFMIVINNIVFIYVFFSVFFFKFFYFSTAVGTSLFNKNLLPTGLKASIIKVASLYYLRLTMCGLVSDEVYQMIVDFSKIVDLLLQPVFEQV